MENQKHPLDEMNDKLNERLSAIEQSIREIKDRIAQQKVESALENIDELEDLKL